MQEAPPVPEIEEDRGWRGTVLQAPAIVREVIAGGLAGATAKSCVAPLERCKILFQTGKLHSAGISSTLSSIWRAEGAAGLFRGNGASVLRIIPYSSIHFGLYEHYRRLIVESAYGEHIQTGVSPLVDLFAGSGAGATAVLVTYPLDLVRTRLAYMTEAGTQRTPSKLNLSQAATSISASSSSSINPATSMPHKGTPHISSTIKRHTIRGVISSTLRQEGIRGLYHGIGPSMYGILPYAGLKFFVYQHLKQYYLELSGGAATGAVGGGGGAELSASPKSQPRLPVPAMLGFGGIAGLIAQTVTYPLDVVRRRMQVEGLKQREPPVALGAPHFPDERLPQSTPAALMAIARRQGWRVLFSGLSINYMKVVPSTAIGFTLYDYLKSTLDLPTHL